MVESFPLSIFDCDADLFSDSDYSPSVWDGSEGETAKWTVGELDLIGYGVPKAFLRRIPREAKEWTRVKVFLEPRRPDSFYFYIASMSALPTDVALRIPQCHYMIPHPSNPGWVPVVEGIGFLDGKPTGRRRTRGVLGPKGSPRKVGRDRKVEDRKRRRQAPSSSSEEEHSDRKRRKDRAKEISDWIEKGRLEREKSRKKDRKEKVKAR